MLKAARALLFESFAAAQQQLESEGRLDDELRLGIRQATTHVAHVSAEVVDFAYHWSGADGIRPGIIQRLYRDTHVSTQHIFVDDNTFTEYGRHLLLAAGSLAWSARHEVAAAGPLGWLPSVRSMVLPDPPDPSASPESPESSLSSAR